MRHSQIRLATAVACLVASAETVAAQHAFAPRADSATQARAAYRRAVGAYRQRDLPTARQEMRRAAELWPTQQAYLETSASLAAAARDTADVVHWLGALAALGIGNSVQGDTNFAAFVGAPAFDAAVRTLTTTTAPAARSTVRLTFPDTMLHAEGVAHDTRTGRWFVGSVRQRRIVAVGENGPPRDFVSPASDGIAGVFGMAVDSARRTLWVATTALPRMEGFTVADSGRIGVFGYDLDTGRLRRRAWAPRDSSTAHTFGDIAVAPNGDVYASDSQSPWIYRFALGTDTLARFVTHPLFRSLQGMAFTRDGGTMYVADYSHGLLVIEMASRAVAPLTVPKDVTALGVDGLYLHRGALVAVQNGVSPARVVRFCLGVGGRSVRKAELLDRNSALADEPTLGVIVGDSAFYVATSQWDKFDDAGRRAPNAKLHPAMVLGLSLDTENACR